jgi:polysaccharide deacetylase 2 family uncharacterized protein YibQ
VEETPEDQAVMPAPVATDDPVAPVVGGVGTMMPAPEPRAAPELPASASDAPPRTFRNVPIVEPEGPGPEPVPEGAFEEVPIRPARDDRPDPVGGALSTPASPEPGPATEGRPARAEDGASIGAAPITGGAMLRRQSLDEGSGIDAEGPGDDGDGDEPVGPAEASLFSIVLIDGPSDGLGRAALTDLPFPLTVAIDATGPTASEAARPYREAGHEVLLTADGPAPAGTARDFSAALTDARGIAPGALGILDAAEGGVSGRPLDMAALLSTLEAEEMVFVGGPNEPDSSMVAASRAGMSAVRPNRLLGASGEADAARVARMLDRAASEAERSGSVVVIGRMSRETVSAIQAWFESERPATMRFVPISDLLADDPEG